jgi:hypothetical protein
LLDLYGLSTLPIGGASLGAALLLGFFVLLLVNGRAPLRGLPASLGAFLIAISYWGGSSTRVNGIAFVVIDSLFLVYCVAVLAVVFGPGPARPDRPVLAPDPPRLDRTATTLSFVFVIGTYVIVWALLYEGVAQKVHRCIRPAFVHHVDALYFTLTVLTTIGFGDIRAKAPTCRWMVSGQMAVDIAVIGILLTGLAARVLTDRPNRRQPEPHTRPAPNEP